MLLLNVFFGSENNANSQKFLCVPACLLEISKQKPNLWLGLNVNIHIVHDDFYWAFTLSKSRN